jgi:hypothetical protein
MSQAEGSSASENVALQAACGWRQSILALVIVLAPMALAVIVMAIGLAARAAWLVMHGDPLGQRHQRASGCMACCRTRSAVGSQ